MLFFLLQMFCVFEYSDLLFQTYLTGLIFSEIVCYFNVLYTILSDHVVSTSFSYCSLFPTKFISLNLLCNLPIEKKNEKKDPSMYLWAKLGKMKEILLEILLRSDKI